MSRLVYFLLVTITCLVGQLGLLVVSCVSSGGGNFFLVVIFGSITLCCVSLFVLRHKLK
jgi:hypothetical protein